MQQHVALLSALVVAVVAGSCTQPPPPRRVPELRGASGAATERRKPDGRRHGEVLVALCFSGGGSRAAYFGARVLEKLSELNLTVQGRRVNLLDEVDYISGVSGGSVATAYHATWWPSGRADRRAYFARFRRTMAADVQSNVFWRILAPQTATRLMFTGKGRTDVLADYFDKYFLGGATWRHLRRHAEAGLAPHVILNAIIYDSERFPPGSKFLFTSLRTDDFYLPAAAPTTEGLRRALRVTTLADLGPTGALKVARGVAASAAFPVLLTPLRVTDRRAAKRQRVDLGDGGIYDNLGVEAVTQRLLAVLRREPYAGALLIVANAEPPYRFKSGLRIIGILSKLSERRARTLAGAVLGRLQREVAPGRAIHRIDLELRGAGRTDDEARRLARIPTAFRISGENQRLIGGAVDRLFAKHGARLVASAERLAGATATAAPPPRARPVPPPRRPPPTKAPPSPSPSPSRAPPRAPPRSPTP